MSKNQDSRPNMALWEMADLITPMAVRVAATFRIADHIVDGQVTAEAIAGAAGLHAGALDRVLRHLVTVGLFSLDGDEYQLTEKGAALRSDHPSGQRALIDVEGAIGRADLSFVELAHVVRTGEPAYPLRYGTTFWDDLAAKKPLAESFDAIMASNVGRDAEQIAQAYDWSKLAHLIDLGGGKGVLLTALLKAHPTLRGTVLDLPRTAERARKTFQDNGLGDRGDAKAGSFFDRLPPGADGYMLSSVLHDWDDESVVAILKRCAEAAGDRGRVFVIEETGDDGESPDTAMDVRHLAYYAGQERGLADNIELAKAAGLAVIGVHSAPGRVATRSVIELKAA